MTSTSMVESSVLLPAFADNAPNSSVRNWWKRESPKHHSATLATPVQRDCDGRAGLEWRNTWEINAERCSQTDLSSCCSSWSSALARWRVLSSMNTTIASEDCQLEEPHSLRKGQKLRTEESWILNHIFYYHVVGMSSCLVMSWIIKKCCSVDTDWLFVMVHALPMPIKHQIQNQNNFAKSALWQHCNFVARESKYSGHFTLGNQET